MDLLGHSLYSHKGSVSLRPREVCSFCWNLKMLLYEATFYVDGTYCLAVMKQMAWLKISCLSIH